VATVRRHRRRVWRRRFTVDRHSRRGALSRRPCSPRQQQQLTCWADNIVSLAVRGEFDDCQRLAKEAFADSALQHHHNLCSANSINVGRLLPQAAYYAKASLEHHRRTGQAASFIIPTGNLWERFCMRLGQAHGPADRSHSIATNANTTWRTFSRPASGCRVRPWRLLRLRWMWATRATLERCLRDLLAPDDVRSEVSAVSVTTRKFAHDPRRNISATDCPGAHHTATLCTPTGTSAKASAATETGSSWLRHIRPSSTP